jgi:hypothetical protein
VAASASQPGRRDLVPTTDSERSHEQIRLIGLWSARAIVVLELAYVLVFVAGFASLGNTSAPLPDPYLGIAEVIILVMAPIMVALMLAIHESAPRGARPFTMVAVGWMIAAAAFTMTVHFVELTVARHVNPAAFPGYARIFDFRWPSTFYAIDIVAWDVFFALAVFVRSSRLRPPGQGEAGASRPYCQRVAQFDRADRAFRRCSRMEDYRHPRLHSCLWPHLRRNQPSLQRRRFHRNRGEGILSSADTHSHMPEQDGAPCPFIPEGTGWCQAGFRPAVSRRQGVCRAC